MPRGYSKNPKHPIDRGAPASVIAAKFGGVKKFTDALSEVRQARGEKPVSYGTTHRWLVRGSIDARHQSDVNEAAKLRGVRIKPLDYVDTRKPAPAPIVEAEAVA